MNRLNRHATLHAGPAATWSLRRTRCALALWVCLTLLCARAVDAQLGVPRPGSAAAEEGAIRAVLARFYEGWNAHDIEQMVSVYADDVDHINVFGEWHQGKAAIRDDLRRFHAGPGKTSQKTYTVEKIRFLTPDVAVAQVRSLSTVGNLGTYVMTKEGGAWRTVSFTNVGYELTRTGPRTGVSKKPGGNR